MHKRVGKQLLSCNISEKDVRNAFDVFGPDVGPMKDTKPRKSELQVDLNISVFPNDIMKRHREVLVSLKSCT